MFLRPGAVGVFHRLLGKLCSELDYLDINEVLGPSMHPYLVALLNKLNQASDEAAYLRVKREQGLSRARSDAVNYSASLPDYARVFYPGTPDPALAQYVDVRSGGEVAGLELSLDKTLGGEDGEKTVVRDPIGVCGQIIPG